jgi:hypothetical protein
MHVLTPNDSAAVGGGLSPHEILAENHIVMAVPEPWPGMPYRLPLLDAS